MKNIQYTYRKQGTRIFSHCQPRIQLEDLCPIPSYLRKQSRPPVPRNFLYDGRVIERRQDSASAGNTPWPKYCRDGRFIAVRFRVSNSRRSNKSRPDIHKKSICFATFRINVRFDREGQKFSGLSGSFESDRAVKTFVKRFQRLSPTIFR